MSSTLMWVVLLLALAGFTALVVRRHVRESSPGSESELLQGFAYVGAAAAVALAAAVVLVAALTPGTARADGLAMLGLFGLTLYQVLGLLVWRVRARTVDRGADPVSARRGRTPSGTPPRR